LDALVLTSAKESAALTEANDKNWRGIPGFYDIVIDRFTYVYNVTNRDDVKP
jgi:hypothetical protein